MLRADQKRAIARKEREGWLKNAHDAAQVAKREVFSAQSAAYAAEKEAKLAIERCARALHHLTGVETLVRALAEADGVDLRGAEMAAFAARMAEVAAAAARRAYRRRTSRKAVRK